MIFKGYKDRIYILSLYLLFLYLYFIYVVEEYRCLLCGQLIGATEMYIYYKTFRMSSPFLRYVVFLNFYIVVDEQTSS